MPALTPEHRSRLLVDTKDAAIAFWEDMRYIRRMAAKFPPDRTELRQISAILRRLFVENDLQLVAAPRLGKFLVQEPDNHDVYKQLTKGPRGFLSSAGFDLGGGVIIGSVGLFVDQVPPAPARSPTHPFWVDVRVDNFLAQKVLYLDGEWVSRRAVLKYVANIASGVHSGTAKEPDEITIENIRRKVAFVLSDKKLNIRFRGEFFTLQSGNFYYDKNEIDPTLLELHAIIYLMTISPQVQELEDKISAELNLN